MIDTIGNSKNCVELRTVVQSLGYDTAKPLGKNLFEKTACFFVFVFVERLIYDKYSKVKPSLIFYYSFFRAFFI